MIDTETPPFAVEHPSFAHHDDLVSEREITRRGDIEAEVPTPPSFSPRRNGEGRESGRQGRDHVPPTGRRLRVLRRECRRCEFCWSCRSPTPIAGRRIGMAPRGPPFPWTGGGSACCSAITRRRMSPCHPTALRRNARKGSHQANGRRASRSASRKDRGRALFARRRSRLRQRRQCRAISDEGLVRPRALGALVGRRRK